MQMSADTARPSRDVACSTSWPTTSATFRIQQVPGMQVEGRCYLWGLDGGVLSVH